MVNNKQIVIGLGEVGSAVLTNLVERYDVDTFDLSDEKIVEGEYDVLHICYPYSEDFVKITKAYKKRFNPKVIIIYSTLKVGTTKQIPRAVHSPIEGVHPNLAKSTKNFRRYIGFNNRKVASLARKIWYPITHKIRLVENSDITEFLKLASTTEYGLNIEFTRYKSQVIYALGGGYEIAKDWNKDYNKLYKAMGIDWARKYVLDAPEGPKGGHCVTPNARLLHEQYPNILVREVAEI